MAIADELIALLGFELTGQDAAKRYESTLGRIEKRAEAVGSAIGTGLRIATAAAAAGFTLLGKSVIDTSSQFEGYKATLETIEGTAEGAQKSLDWITKFAAKTPYDVAGITEAFVQLKAYGIDPIADDAMKRLGDTASAMGKPLSSAVEMFADASGMEFERLKEFGLRATQAGDQVTFKWNKNGKELTKTVKKNGDEVRKFILDNLGDRFSGAMDKQSRTWAGMMSNLGDSWTQFQLKIGQSGFFDKIKDRLSGLLDTISTMSDNGTLNEWADNIGSVFEKAADVIWAVGSRIVTNLKYISENFDTLKPIIYAFGAAIGALFISAFPVVAAFVLLGLAIDDILAYMQGGESLIGRFKEWIQDLIPVSDSVALAMAGLGAAVSAGLLAAFAIKPVAMVGIVIRAISGISMLMAPAILAAMTALSVPIMSGLTAAFALLSNPIGWAVIIAGVGAAAAAYFWEDISAAWAAIDFSSMGTAIGDGIISGVTAMASAIASTITGIVAAAVAAAMAGLSFTVPVPGATVPAGTQSDGSIAPGWTGETLLGNASDNLAKTGGDAPVNQTITDARTDARSSSSTTSVVVNQQVTQPAAAPAAVANAVGAAAAGAVAAQRTQIETEPSF